MSFLLSDLLERTAGLQPAPASQPQRSELLNVSVAVASLVLVLLVIPGGFFWHQFQIRRNASELLRQADKLEADEKWREAAALCFRYLKLRPDDAKGWVRLATAFDRAAETKAQQTKAIELYFQTIALAKDDPALRRRLAELLLELERYAVAEYQADQLLELIPTDPTGWRIKALSSHAQNRVYGRIPLVKVARSYRKAVETNPADELLSARLADLYRRDLKSPSQAERNTLADAVMNRLVENNPRNSACLLARYEYRRRYQLPAADPDLDLALELAPNEISVLLAAGQRGIDQRDFSATEKHFRRVLELVPNDRRGYLGLGRALSASGRPNEAIEIWQEGLRQVGAGDLMLNLKLAEAQITLGRLAEAEQTLSALDAVIAGGAKNLSQRQKRILHDTVDFVRARWWVAQGDFTQAVPVLRRVLATREASRQTAEDTAQQVEILHQLAACYSGRKQFDLAAATFEQAIDLEPQRPDHLIAAAEAWEAAGQLVQAINRYEQALILPDCPPAAWVLAARAQWAWQRTRPEGQRDWEPLERAIDGAREAKINSTLLNLIEADYLALRGSRSEALGLLERASHGDDAERVLQSLIMAYEKWEQPQDADRALADYETRFGQRLDGSLMRAALASHRKQWDAAIEALDQALERATPEQRPSIVFQRAQIELKAGRPEAARQRLRELAADDPRNVALVEIQAELAWQEADWPELILLEQRLADLEGESGARWRYYRGRRRLRQDAPAPTDAKAEADAVLAEVSELSQRIELERPAWGPGWQLRGQVEERRGRPSEAITAYELALRYGYENVEVYQQLIALLYQQQRIAEADRYLARLMDLTAYLPQVSALAIGVATGQGQLDRALQLAADGIAARPDDPFARIWRAQALMLSGHAEEAVGEFRRAIALAPGKVEPWMALIGFHLRQGDSEAAIAALDEMLAAVKLEPAERTFLAAQVNELAQNRDRAEEEYRKALELNPDDLAVLQRSAEFLLERDPEVARAAMRRMLEVAPEDGPARAQLAVNLGEQGGESNWKEAFELLSPAESAPDHATADELRALARLLVEHGGVEEHQRAIRVLEQVLRSGAEILPEDRLILSRLFETTGRIPRARQELTALISTPEPNPDHLAAYVDFLLRNGYVNDATSWLTQLRTLDPTSLRALELHARWLQAQQRTAEAEDLIEEFMAKRLESFTSPAQKSQAALSAAKLYTAVGLDEPAQRWFGLYQESTPLGYLAYARWLAEHGRLTEALSRFPQDPEQYSSEVAIGLAETLVLGRAGADVIEPVESFLEAALERNPRDVPLRLAVGNVRYLSGRTLVAVTLYRQALELEPNSPAIMNNLALALAEDHQSLDEAEKTIRRALAMAGRQLLLQDTLGLVLLRRGQLNEARAVLEPLTTLSVAGPAVYFHLALVDHQLESFESARVRLAEAYRRGLDRQPLTPGERRSLDYLEKALRNVAVN